MAKVTDKQIREHVRADRSLSDVLSQNAEQIGAKVRAKRHERAMGQPDLAVQLGVSPMAVQKYETGATSLTPARLVAIADALKCKTTDLIP